MKIMIIGAGGFVGSAVERACIASGHIVTCISRKRGDAKQGHLSGDRNDPEQISRMVASHAPDAIIDMIAYGTETTEALLDALDGWDGRYVLISSADVYRNFGLLHRKEDGTPDLGILAETAPLRSNFYPYNLPEPRPDDAPDKWMDGYDKIPIEAAVQGRRPDWTVCRLPMVYGPANPQPRFNWAIGPLKAGVSILPLPGPWLDWITTFGFVDNVAAAIAHVTAHSAASRETFNITDDDDAVAHTGWIERFATVLNWSGEIARVDDADHPIARATEALDLSVPLNLSGEKLRQLTGFSPPVSLEDCLIRTANPST
ncbi:MAG: NAD-dependent epimerase/dehydratase family protein [Pseudomonadota bacterium]